MPRLSAGTMEQRRRAIAAAGYRCFVRDGYAETSVDDICAEAEVSKGAFYTHFVSKRELIRAVAGYRSDDLAPLPSGSIEELCDALLSELLSPMLQRATATFELEGALQGKADTVLGAQIAANLDSISLRVGEAIAEIAVARDRPLHDLSFEAGRTIVTHCLGHIFRSAVWEPATADEARADIMGLLRAVLSELSTPGEAA